MKILLIQQKMIGDVLVSSLLCEHIKEHLPDAEVHYLIEEHTKAVVQNNPFIDKIVLFKKEFKTVKSQFYGFLKSIRASNYDVIIDIYGKLESNLITYFSKAKIKVAYPKSRSKFLYTHHIPIKSRQSGNRATTIDDRLALLSPIISEKLDVKKKPRIYLSKEEEEATKNFLRLNDIDLGKPLLMLGILGSGENKTYPLKYMAEVVNAIAENSEAILLFNYIPSQESEAQKLYELCNGNTRDRISFGTFAPDLRKFLALLKCCDAYIGNEGGSTNMAKALDIPTFSIFAPWIDKIGWNTYADSKNVSVHVSDFFPEKIKELSKKKIKSESGELYKMLRPELFKNKLYDFLSEEIFPDQ